MPKRLLFLAAFFTVTPVFVFSVVLYSLFHHYEVQRKSFPEERTLTSGVQYDAVPDKPAEAVLGVESRDARIEVLEEFFKRYNSPLQGQGELIVRLADEHGLDYRLVPAIAFKESTLCQKIPKGSYNCWGYGIYGEKVTRFDSYPDAIDTVTKGLARNYIAKGYTSPEEIMSKYTPSSNGSWAETVNLIMNRIHESM